ncbi:MAG: hypothetical protein FWF53_09715 [Candidatus Azobacteroides sp.]|nr:hypothetical protein [Candidatus Azobacteroides sp.]
MNDDIISLSDFMNRCRRHERYIGYVLDLGYVSGWRTERIVTEHPVNSPKALTGDAQFIQTVDVPIIKNSVYSGLQNTEYSDESRMASWGGIAATAGTIIDQALVMEPKYIQINPQGTRILNPDYGKVKLGTVKIAGGLGFGLLLLSAGYDLKAHDNNEITKDEMLVDIAVNGIIYTVGLLNPVLGVVLGLLYMSFTAPVGPSIGATYEEIHGTVTPADKTRVAPKIPKISPEELLNGKKTPTKEFPVITRGR